MGYYIAAAIAYAIFSLIGGFLGYLFTSDSTGFMIGFLIVFIPLFAVTVPAIRYCNKLDEKFNRCDIKKIWEESGYDKDKTTEELSKQTELDKTTCYNRLVNTILGDIPKEEFIKNGYDVDKAIESTYEKTHFDKDVIKNKMIEVKELRDKELKKKEEEEKREKEIRQNAIYARQVKSMSPKQQYKQNRKNGIVSCPKCGSVQITTTNKKISIGKGVAGAAVGSLGGPLGTVVGGAVGATHSKKVYCVCMNCGHQWEPK